MFDTVKTKTDRALKPKVLEAIEAGNGACRLDDWFFRNSATLDHNDQHRTKLRGQHKPTGLVVQGYENVVELTTASLPTILFGHNGRLIRSPEQFAEAQRKLKAILDGVTTARTPRCEYVRVDLVLHFRCDIPKLIAAHRHCRHPLIRNETDEYGDRGLKLPGKNAAIMFYDKQEEMGQGRGDILRVEAQLHKPKLNELFGRDDQPLYDLDFGTAYRVYRKLLCAFTPVEVPTALGLNALLAQCEAANCKMLNGLGAMENYRATVSHETFLTRRRQIKGMTLSAAGIDWSAMLPEHHLPLDLPDVESLVTQ